ncbi:MAG TPA: ABC transporter substrate-binding protein [Candidatus Binataceae bacterium]|nr:ABC transporter substrate-binding protein [Candidatus Binataceae bacterium]
MKALTPFGAALAILALSELTGCRGDSDGLDLPKTAKVLHLASVADVPSLDPAVGYDTSSWGFEQMIFDTLVRYSDAGVDLVPDLATQWEIAPDAKSLTFHLRRDASFTNGRAVVSGDFKYAIERVLTPSVRSKGTEYFRSIVGAEDFVAGRAKEVTGIENPDAWTIIFRLTEPDPIFVQKLAMPFAAAVPREAVDQWGNDDFSRHVIGSGPFTLKEWRSGERIVLVRNPHYFDPSWPRLDAIVQLIGVDLDLEWLKFETGELDVSAIPPAEFLRVMKTPKLKALAEHIVTLSTDYLGMNCQMKPFDDVRVRRAFNLAIRKDKASAILNGRAVPAVGILPPGLPGYDPNIDGYPYDPTKAKALLEAAGVGRDFAPTLWMRADQTEMTLGESIQQDLAEVGVHAVLKPLAWSSLLEAIRQPNTADLFSLGWEADFPDPQNFLEVLFAKKQFGANNDTFYSNPQVEKLLAEAAPVSDLSRRYQLYDQAQKLIMQDAPWVVLYHPVSYVIRQPWVHDYILNPMRPTRLERVWISAREGEQQTR